ncbi:CRAL-TRIO domain-containing protein [Circinella umbellata]|nr:CRAL-TRIO domain-containing protein [Circinella umbellata]
MVDVEMITTKVIKYPPLDASQLILLRKLRDYVNNIMFASGHEYHQNEKRFLTDATLIRHLHARKWDFVSAKTTLENTMYWLWTFIQPRFENSREVDRQTKHIMFCLERGIRLMASSTVDIIAIIIAFKKAGYSHSPSIATCKKFLNILSDHYPERLGITFVVNPPWYFFTTFKMISPLMDPQTKAKINYAFKKMILLLIIINGFYLKDYISLDMLEADFGGIYNFTFDIEHYWSFLLRPSGTPYKIIDYL